MAELLFWPTLLAYGEAAIAFGASTRRPADAGRLAIWGVRVGWLLQTALLAAQALRAEGFPWSTRGGALNLFVWLVVSAYLIWGCRPAFRLLGLAVMPPAAALFALAHLSGGLGGEERHPGYLLALHVAVMLAACAGLTLAAGLSGFYLWHDARLKRRVPSILRLRVPPLETLDSLAARTVVVSFVTLTVGIALGVASLLAGRGEIDTAMAATVVAWATFGAYVLLRRLRGLRGRRAARLCLLGFAVVAVVLPLAHFA